MKILKLLNKKYLSIVFILIISSLTLPIYAEDQPVDIWSIEKESKENPKKKKFG